MPSELPLNGVRVIDLTQNVAGPFCTQILGDLGAEVIKVERPGRGDDTREWRPPQIAGQATSFLALNRNKKSIAINLDHAGAPALLARLAAQADVFVHAMKPGSAEARGLGDAQLRQANARLVYCAISAFGGKGPLGALPGYDPLVQAFTGIMSTTGHEGAAPVRVGVSLVDMGTGMWAALGILAALMQRGASGQGRLVEASLFETGMGWMSILVANYLATGSLPRKMGTAVAMMAPYESFRSADGHVFIAAGNDALFHRVCDGLGCPELKVDPRFATNPARVENRAALKDAIEGLTSRRPTGEIIEALRKTGAPCSELHTVADVLAHDQTKALDIMTPLPIAGAPDYEAVALPVRLDGQRAGTISGPPALGEHTDEILADAGYSAADIAKLRAERLIA